MFIKRVCICIAFLFIVTRIFAGDIVLTNETNVQKLGGYLEILNNSNKKYNSSNVIDAKEFYTSTRKMPVFSSLDVNIWIRFSVLNQSGSIAYLNFDHPNTSVITLYKDSAGKLVKIYTGGNALMQQNKSELPNYIVNLQQGPNSDITYYGHIESSHPAVLDIYVGSYGKVVEQSNKKLN
ncbi:MAG: 7TMR-DISMED2 domain-containing protein, partial [Parafilimonas sp.]